ncbi:MAG: PHP domain-containing protein [Planctomycetales bacterium]|nr:PHP domain-containing protein [Planctomycetales bacterium]
MWLKADTHLHTTFSDGGHSVDEVAANAERAGCDVIAITDHADGKGGAPEYIAAIEKLRIDHPKLLVIAGLEWNIPPWGGDDHATVLFPPGLDNANVMTLFKARFDDYQRDTHEQALADEALRWLASQKSPGGAAPVVLFNHPSRKWDLSAELLKPLEHLRSVNDMVVGFSGAPGHQAGTVLGAYDYRVKPMDRWDPLAAEVGGVWDALLARGIDIWAARAPSDFHRTTGRENSWSDYWPGEFSETWIYAPDRTADGVLRALRAGSFFAGHGHIAREVQLEVAADGLDRPATAGEVIEAREGTSLQVTLAAEIPAVDWSGTSNHIDEVELIAIGAAGAESIVKQPPHEGRHLLTHSLRLSGGGVVLRARLRRVVEEGPDLLFYTNPIRVISIE